jgi:hypothetical protein
MRNAFLVLTLLVAWFSSFAQNNNSGASGGKVTEDKPAAAAKKKPLPKQTADQDRSFYSPCGVYYKNRADMSGESDLADKWFSLGESANRHFWYNPHKTNCDAKTGALKSWIKEEHKNTHGNFALVLYEFKCKTNQIRVKTVIEYDEGGSVLETNDHDGDTWQEVAPGTAGVTIMKTVCRRP